VSVFARSLAVFLLALLLASRGAAEEKTRNLPAVVRIADPDDRPLLERVRGQTNDLDVTLLTDSETPLESSLGAQLESARALAESYQARVVVWFVRDERALTVFVSEPKAGRVLVRRLERSSEQLAYSAQHEAAALVVRTAMRALAHGGEIGVAEKEIAPPPPAPPPTPPPPPPPEPQPEPSIAPPPEPLPVGWELTQHVGGRVAFASASGGPQYGLIARLALRYRFLQAELRGALGWPESVNDSVARVHLLRHGVSVHMGFAPWKSEQWLLVVAWGAGINIFITDVEARKTGALDANDDSLVLGVVSADATLRYMPTWTKRRVGLALLGGLDILPQAPTLGYYDANGEFVERDHVHNLLPTLALELAVRLR
jgi:hypothetical protein